MRGVSGGAENNGPEIESLQTCSMPNERMLSANSLQLERSRVNVSGLSRMWIRGTGGTPLSLERGLMA